MLATAGFWYAGFDTIPQAMEEVESGTRLRLLPRVIGASIIFALLFYCLVILATAMSLPRPQLLESELPAAAAIEAAFASPILGRVVLFAGLCGLITTWNALFFAATRIVFAMARAHMIPHRLAAVHERHGSPSAAVIFVAVMGAVVAAWEPFRAAGGRIPAEWMVLGAWSALGFVFYRAAAPLRRTVSEERLRWLILSDKDPRK